MSQSIPFGVQSWCFRHFKTNAEVAQKVREIGVDSIELCGVYADFAKPETMDEALQPYRAAGISILSIGVQTFEGNDIERAWFESAAKLGAKHISAHFKIDSYLKAIPKVRAWSREFGIRVGIHCHGGYMFGGSPDVLEYLLSIGGPEIGLCIDTAWAMQIGPWLGQPVEWVKKFSGRIYGIHFKDFVFEKNGQWRDVVVGEGTLDLPAFTAALKESGFDGMAVVEYEADVENPVPALTRCVASMRAKAV
ncbi:Sugar phosphate isomerase/epimerase [Verrucomicrobium sp. GAS474]|uniref:sugar phosphate isomerase/epimerase family protein n=1 Tax=Verrucomicrobium sp. GAS474 TaxID=1882831 RepID=UPI00087926B5|nr:sugar phosphate isomerase/epimerase [Verrucomicrobium sp. GAS474]SDU20182.1 Sugar phosphate isomerase/epimerase [Verrucomicrobium sp. GAS474]